MLEPDALIMALGERYRAEGHPRDLTIVHSMGLGDKISRGMSYLAQPGLIKRIIGGHMGNSTHIGEMIRENQLEAYNVPLGVLSQLFRDTAAGRPGLLTKTGLGTFVDPRLGGPGLNEISTAELVEVTEIDGEEYLFYRSIPLDFAFVRGSYADEAGNIAYDNEPSYLDTLETCMAVRRGRGEGTGRAYLQVKSILDERFHPRRARIPAMLVDALVEYPEQWQTYVSEQNDVLAGNERLPEEAFAPMPFSWRKVIARRAAAEVRPGDVVNLGVGVPDGVASVLQERKMLDQITMTNEHGVVGGVTSLGMTFGASMNFDSLLTMPNIIDLYQGGLLDIAFLGFAQADQEGNVNVSLYNGEIMGAGGFIDITQNARRVVFCGSFTAGGLRPSFTDGQISIDQEGRTAKFVDHVEQITFSGTQARARGQEVHIVTERAVFALGDNGLELVELAPGVDFERDVAAHCGFPVTAHDTRLMPATYFESDDK
ncbi:acyl CoA:acetate/3-ketoacid CoA transferase [Microbacterium aurum]|nr:acyl CoA:acetate/3-ketoacid CoA transferase [Microbacterium aurum]